MGTNKLISKKTMKHVCCYVLMIIALAWLITMSLSFYHGYLPREKGGGVVMGKPEQRTIFL